MKILSIDLGEIMGVAVHDGKDFIFTQVFIPQTIGKPPKVSLMDVEKFTKELIFRWRPSLIIIPYPTRFYKTLSKHFKMIGVIECMAEKYDIQIIESNDARCKKIVIGNGHADKDRIAKHYRANGMVEKLSTDSSDILDAVMFIEWYLKVTEE